MSQLCSSANQYGKQQSCEYGKMSTVCPFCVKTQTQHTGFFSLFESPLNNLLEKFQLGDFSIAFLIASLRINEWWISSQNHYLANLLWLSNQLIQYHQEAKKHILGLNFSNISIEAFALRINARKGFFTINLLPQFIHFFHNSPINFFQLFL
jgi:hypothetical protein